MQRDLNERISDAFKVLEAMLSTAKYTAYAEWRCMDTDHQRIRQSQSGWLNEALAKERQMLFNSNMPLEATLAIGSLFSRQCGRGECNIQYCAGRAYVESTQDEVVVAVRTAIHDHLDQLLVAIALLLLEDEKPELVGCGCIHGDSECFNSIIEHHSLTSKDCSVLQVGAVTSIQEYSPDSKYRNSVLWHFQTRYPAPDLGRLSMMLPPELDREICRLSQKNDDRVLWIPASPNSSSEARYFGIVYRETDKPLPVVAA